MTINEAMKKYRLPPPPPPADPARTPRNPKPLGDTRVSAGQPYTGTNTPCYFGAAYEFLTDDHTCEGMIGLRAASGGEFEDDGNAIAWAMQQ